MLKALQNFYSALDEQAFDAVLRRKRYLRLQELKAPADILAKEKKLDQEYSSVPKARIELAELFLKVESQKTAEAIGEIMSHYLPHEFLPAPYEKEFLLAIGSKDDGCYQIGKWFVVFLREDAPEITKFHEFAHVALGHRRRSRSDVVSLRQEVAAVLLSKKWMQKNKKWDKKIEARLIKALRYKFVEVKVRQPQQAEKLKPWFERRLDELQGMPPATRKLLNALFPEESSK